ncbi:MAG TPA: TIM barrel protein [Methanoregulaceae archaeon]|nr:TIM barrel protein [Methanoregulaceae archaeon]
MILSTDNHRPYLIGCGVRSDDLETFKGLAALAEQGVIDHIQVLVVPEPEPRFRSRVETMAAYDALCILHAPHHLQGVNPCFPSAIDPENPWHARKSLESALIQTFQMADELSSPMIVLHAGHYPKGMREEAFSGFSDFLDRYFDPRYILENLPEVFRDLIFIGTSAPDLVRLSNGKIKGYCLDFPHLYCTSNYWGLSFERELMKFETLPVSLHHLSNSRKSSFRDEHLPLDHPDGGIDLNLVMGWISNHRGIQTSLEYKYDDIGIYYSQIREFNRLFKRYHETMNGPDNGQC